MKDPSLERNNLDERNQLEIANLKDPDGRPLIQQTKMTVKVDSAEQKELLEQLKASEERFKRLSEAAFEAIAIHQQGRIIDVNQQYLDMFGYTLDEVKQTDGIEMIAPQSRDCVKEKMASGYEGPYEVFGIKKDGSVFPIEIQAKESVLDGQPVRIGAIKDISEQKEMEQQVVASEKRYRELYENSPIALYRTRISDGKLLECNKALVELWGYDSKEEFQAVSTAADRYVDINDRAVFLEKLKKDKRIKSFHAQCKRKDGKLVWIEATAEIFPEQGFMEGAMRDITVTKVLSVTEKKVLDQLMQGKSNKEIARELGRSVRTVEDHRGHIMHKLGVDNLVDLTQIALNLPNHHSEESKN